MLFILFFLSFTSLIYCEEKIPRTIIALYQKSQIPYVEKNNIHLFLEMPLNHLGLKVVYHDIEQGMPNLEENPDVRGILSCFPSNTKIENPKEYLRFLIDAMQKGKLFVLMEYLGFEDDQNNDPELNLLIDRFFYLLGIEDKHNWINLTYSLDFPKIDKTMVGFERSLPNPLPAYPHLKGIRRDVISYLTVAQSSDDQDFADLIITSNQGGYVSQYFAFYSHYNEKQEKDERQWIINPFKFFKTAFQTDDIPKPDTTTLAGRRIYYSHIDGDGWNNITYLEKYQQKATLSAEIILKYAIIPYPDLPVTLAPIAAEVDPLWVGSLEGVEIAKDFLNQKQVEAGTHTYSHPFKWRFFEGNDPDKEKPFLHRYPMGHWKAGGWSEWVQVFNRPKTRLTKEQIKEILGENYITPRAYANYPFSIDREVEGSVNYIQSLLPEKKKVKCLMWSGDTSPFEKAIKKTRDIGVLNINGGDCRFDQEFPSFAWVPPLGRQVGDERTIYASNSNENTYTDSWSKHFYGFQHLIHTLKNTETPIRLKPINIYYHIYSGEKEAALNALIKNLDYARSQKIHPVNTSFFIRTAQGFFTTEIDKIEEKKWRIKNRGAMQTIRFDYSTDQVVDWKKSSGIIGQKHYQGSLYIYLDRSYSEPIIALKDHKNLYTYPLENNNYLIDSRWRIYNLKRKKHTFSFGAKGFGIGEMEWQVKHDGDYKVEILRAGKRKLSKIFQAKNHRLKFSLPNQFNQPLKVKVSYHVTRN